jgi:hypothetical protein
MESKAGPNPKIIQDPTAAVEIIRDFAEYMIWGRKNNPEFYEYVHLLSSK